MKKYEALAFRKEACAHHYFHTAQHFCLKKKTKRVISAEEVRIQGRLREVASVPHYFFRKKQAFFLKK